MICQCSNKFVQQHTWRMLKDHFQRSTATLNNLRSEQFKVGEYLNKGKYRLKQKFFGKGKKHYDFDLNSQEFFHEYIDDVIFEQTEIQQIFYNQIHKSLEQPPAYNNKIYIKDGTVGPRKNPSEVRVQLARHFRNRSTDLNYKKYLTMLRLHNLGEQQHLPAVQSRTHLLDKQIEQCISRQTRLCVEDYFQSTYTQGGKPVPVNQNGQPIYKYLDEEDCWFSNISREDVQVYLRNVGFREQVLQDAYWPYWYQAEYLVFGKGLAIVQAVEGELAERTHAVKESVVAQAKVMVGVLQRGLEDISPGNLQQKQYLSNFIYKITGVASEQPITVPFYPATYMQLCQNYNKVSQSFFKALSFDTHKDIIDLLPKLNSFISIMFKYQNKEILQGQKQIKLGLEDDVDIKKQLITMLQQQWVTRNIKIDYNRFDYKMYLRPVDWELDNYSQRLEKQIRLENENGYANDPSLEELMHAVRLTKYGDFRKIMRKKSEKLKARLQSKYDDIQMVERYCRKTDQEINVEKLSELYRVKSVDSENTKSILKQSTRKFFSHILKDHIIVNPVQIEIQQSLNCIKVRQLRTKVLNILNALRSYHRNIDLDLRVVDGCNFQFQIDDDFLINSNKQLVEKFERQAKDNETQLSKAYSGAPTLDNQDFMMKGVYKKQMLYKKDRIEAHYYGENIPHIFVLEGRRNKNILYDIVLEDLKLVEKRILQIGTHFINRYERVIKMKNLTEIVDRMALLAELFQYQMQYLFHKFQLIEAYYYIYENTMEPLHAHKIGKIIVDIIYEKPEIDLHAEYYSNSYMDCIEAVKKECQIVRQWSKMLESEEKQQNKLFHKKFADACEIPLTLWAYIYGDIETKGARNYTKLQRMNSVSSKMSKNSREEKIIATNELRSQIREQFEQESEQNDFNIEQYDEYLLKKNMDDIFEDIVGGAEGNKQPKDAGGLGASSLGTQNVTINPKFEGGPYALLNYLPEIKITSEHSQKLLNFTENLCQIVNIHDLIKKLTRQASEQYGFHSLQDQLTTKKHICNMIHRILLSPATKPQQIYQTQTDDLYFQTVSKDCKAFQQIMQPILDLPSSIQLAMQSTHEKHQNSLSSYDLLQNFDVGILGNLVKYEKPVNSAVYRELNLSINLMEFVRVRDRMWHLQCERMQVFEAYRSLAAYCDVPLDMYSHCYGRSGQSEIFYASSELKMYFGNYLRRPTFNSSIEELRTYYELEEAELRLFRSYVQGCKDQLQDYIRLQWNFEKQQVNQLIRRKDILLSSDVKNVRMVVNRIKSHLGSLAGEVLKTRSYLKYKNHIKVLLEDKIREINTDKIEESVYRVCLNNDKKKYSRNCLNILTEKVKKLMNLQYMRHYTDAIKQQTANNETLHQLIMTVGKIRNYVVSLPYLSKLFVIPTEFQQIRKKAFYDQKKQPIVEQAQQRQHDNIYYIESKQQILQRWVALGQSLGQSSLAHSIEYDSFIRGQQAPVQKNDIFQWMFKIPRNNIDDKQKQAIRHLLRVYEPYSGRISLSEYRYARIPEPSRNKFSQMHHNYTTILSYLESNLLIITLQLDDDIIDSLYTCIQHHIDFEQAYPLLDEAAIYETNPKKGAKQAAYLEDSVMAPIFIYENRRHELEAKLKAKITSRGYTLNKIHWAVVDEILDFIISKVQGYGVIRHCMLQMKEQITLFGTMKSELALQYMKAKTDNIHAIMWLALQSTYQSKNDSTINASVPVFIDQLVNRPPLSLYQSSLSHNTRRGISQGLCLSEEATEQEKNKFNQGIYNFSNNLMVNKLKFIFNFVPVDVASFVESYLYKAEKSQESAPAVLSVHRHNFQYLEGFRHLIKKTQREFRFQLFARVRQNFELGKTFALTKVTKPETQQLMKVEQKKTSYFNYLIQARIQMIALCVFKLAKFADTFPQTPDQFWKCYREMLGENKQIIEINTFNIYDQLQAYQQSNKIVFSKTEQALTAVVHKTEKSTEQYNRMLRMVIFSKLTAEQFKNQVLESAIRLLKAEKLPKPEQKKIQNSSLLPRVHLVSSFSSPLLIERKTYISQQYKLAFVQAFINRFRNKVSRVDLLSSGYGFVITVPDLEDCVNFMNKLLFTFTQKQFKVRSESFYQYYEILIDAIKSKNQLIAEQKSLITYLQDKVKNTMEAQFLSKVSKLLQEKVVLQQKINLLEQTSNGLQHRVRKAVQHEYDLKITSLEKQNEELKAKFESFKDLLIKLTKDSTKNNFLSLVNILKDQVSNTLSKKIDLTESFKSIQQVNVDNKLTSKTKVKQQQVSIDQKQQQQNEQDSQYNLQDVQRCKIGQDIIHDPYYVTKLINKMRVFNVFKLGVNKIRHEHIDQKKKDELTSLHKIQDKVIAQTQRQMVLREELIKAQEQLSKKSSELEKIKHTIQSLQNEKAKLKILLVTKQKKIEQKDRENDEIKRKIEDKLQKSRVEVKDSIEPQKAPVKQLPKLSTVRQQKKSRKKIEREAFLTNIEERSASFSLYQKFELSNKDATWKQKCQQLYLQNKRLLNQVSKLKQGIVSGTATPIVREGHSLNLRNKKASQLTENQASRSEKRKFPNLSFKYGVLKGSLG